MMFCLFFRSREISKVVAHMWENIEPEVKEVSSLIILIGLSVDELFSNINEKQLQQKKNISNN